MAGERELALARQGDEDAFRAVVEPHLPGLYRAAFLVTLDADLARDAVQEALVRAYRFLGRLRPGQPVGAWLHRLALNEARRLCRRRRRQAAPAPGLPALVTAGAAGLDPTGDPEGAAILGEDRRRLWEAMAWLSPAHRTILVLRYYHDLPESEIARLLGVPRGTVKSRLHHARRWLRERIGAEAPDLLPFPIPRLEGATADD